MSMGKVQMPEVPRYISSQLVVAVRTAAPQHAVTSTSQDHRMETLWLYPEAP